jgi:hypothetical protein
MGRFHRGRAQWKPPKCCVWSTPASLAGCFAKRHHDGAVELHGGRFVPVDLIGEVVGNYATLFDARAAPLQARR